MGTSTTVCEAWGSTLADFAAGAAGVLWCRPRTIATLQRGSDAPLMYHLWPVTDTVRPSSLVAICVCMLVASDEAVWGSVIAKQDLICPLASGLSHLSFCCADPNLSSTSMLPVSGAEQLNTSGANAHQPVSSHTGAYSRCVRAAPPQEPDGSMSLVRKKLKRSWWSASFLSSSMRGCTSRHRLSDVMCSYSTPSAGKMR
mmetsp:Transcript_19690/g.56469  ORF Transcript_19690/g.56469 Transcript_19690/m.56469 type:complete len:200 (+) Transcript_19690:2876-3475(+)